MSTNEKIRSIVRKIAKINDLTIRDLASRAEINMNTLNGFLNEKNGLSLDKAEKLLRSMGLEIVIRRIRYREE